MAKKMQPEHRTGIRFDTYSLIKRLVKQGFKEPQAKELIDIVSESREFDISQLATKADVLAVKADVALVRQEMKTEVEKIRTEVEKVRTDVEKARVDFIRWQIATIITISGVMFACFKYFLPHLG